MRRYLRLLVVFWKSMVLNELEYRANFVVSTLVSVAWSTWTVLGVTLFFQYRDRIGDWTYQQTMVIVGLFLMFNGLVSAFLRPNVERLMEHIRTGTLDFILTKPVNSQFHASLREMALWSAPDFLVGAGVLAYGLVASGAHPSLVQVALFALLLVAAAVMLYALVLALATSAFWLVQADNILELLFTFYEAGRFPITIYPQWMRIVLTFVVPIAFITTVPAEVVLDRLEDPLMIVYALVIAAGLGWLSSAYWRFALRHYASASS